MKAKYKLITLAIFILVSLGVFLFSHFKSDSLNIVIEANSGPYSDIGLYIVGFAELTNGDLIVGTKSKGVFKYTNGGKWLPFEEISKLKDISTLRRVRNEIFISALDGTLLRFSIDSKLISSAQLKAFNEIQSCGNKVIWMTSSSIGEINQKNEMIKFSNAPSNIKAIDCTMDTVFVGTEGFGLWQCDIKERNCQVFKSKLPSKHVAAVYWNSRQKSLFVGLYGDVDFSIFKMDGDTLLPIGNRIGDIVSFVPQNNSMPLALTESGHLYQYFGSSFKRVPMQELLTKPIIHLLNDQVLAASFNRLVKFDSKFKSNNLGGPTIIGQADSEYTMGNSFVWDILISNNGTVYTATGQSGVWWSSDGGLSWQKMSNGLPDPKIHTLFFDDTTQTLFAGGHSLGLFECKLPCVKWTRVNAPELIDADVQGIAMVDGGFAVATEKGLAVLNYKSKKVMGFYPLTTAGGKESSDLWTIKSIDSTIFVGVYSKPNRPTGVWSFQKGAFSQAVNLEYPVTGFEQTEAGNFLVATLKGLFLCRPSICTMLLEQPVNRLNVGSNHIYAATTKGVVRLDKDGNNPRWITDVPAQVVKLLSEDQETILLVGTTERGVMRVKIW